jgi:hypothetical protein
MFSKNIKDEDFVYIDLPCEKVADEANKFQAILSKFLDKSRLVRNDIECNDSLIFKIIERLDQRKDYYRYFHSEISLDKQDLREMSQVKETALLCYWIIKYKPIMIIDKYKREKYFQHHSCTVNEALAAYIFTAFIVECNGNCNKEYYTSAEYLREVFYSFMHEDISKEAFIFSLGSLVCIK